MSDALVNELVVGVPTATCPLRVGLIDSGWNRLVDEPRVAPGISVIGSSGSVLPEDHDHTGHGTACGSLILRLAPHVTVIPIQVFRESNQTSPNVIVRALEVALLLGFDVVNLSLATERLDSVRSLYRACAALSEAGTLVVASALGGRGRAAFPAAFEPVISAGVGPAEQRLPLLYRGSSLIECFVRPDRVSVLTARSTIGTRTVTSSLATAIVTGVVCRLCSQDQPRSIDAIRHALSTIRFAQR